MDQYRSRPKLSENFEAQNWGPLVHTFSWGNSYGPIIGPYLFLGKFIWTHGPESSSKVSPYTGIGPWMALPSVRTVFFFPKPKAEPELPEPFSQPSGPADVQCEFFAAGFLGWILEGEFWEVNFSTVNFSGGLFFFFLEKIRPKNSTQEFGSEIRASRIRLADFGPKFGFRRCKIPCAEICPWRFPGTETGTGTVLSLKDVLKHIKTLFVEEPPEPKTGTDRTFP